MAQDAEAYGAAVFFIVMKSGVQQEESEGLERTHGKQGRGYNNKGPARAGSARSRGEMKRF